MNQPDAMMGEFRAAAESGDLSHLRLEDDPEHIYLHYLSNLPHELLVTGSRWAGVDESSWQRSLRGEHTLEVCGLTWWSGYTWRHSMRWSLAIRRDALQLFERAFPQDMRPRGAVEALERWLEHSTTHDDIRHDRHLERARHAAGGAFLDAAREDATYTTAQAARTALHIEPGRATSEAARAWSSEAARLATAAGADDEAVRHAQHAARTEADRRQRLSWLSFMVTEGHPRRTPED